MTLEDVVVTKLQQLPENARQQLLLLIDAWIEKNRTTDTRDIQQALAAVQSTCGQRSNRRGSGARICRYP